MRNPLELGGAYSLFNAIISQLSIPVSALLYWRYYVPSTAPGEMLAAVMSSAADNSTTTNATAEHSLTSNHSLTNLTSAPFAENSVSAANYTLAHSTGVAGLNDRKIDPLTLTAVVGMLLAMWAMAVVGLWLTINPEYRRTFWSTQTGCAYAQSFFLDNDGNDYLRAQIFCHNERQWRSIRDRVKQWVFNMYATWEALKPAWLNDATKARIPDSFMPAEALRQENARTPGGRRHTLENAGPLRRMSLVLGPTAARCESNADAAPRIPVPTPHLLARMGGGDDGGATLNDPLARASASTCRHGAAGAADASSAVVVDIGSDAR